MIFQDQSFVVMTVLVGAIILIHTWEIDLMALLNIALLT